MLITIVVSLIIIKVMVKLWLSHLNRQEVLRHAGARPDAFKEVMDEETYQKSVNYTLTYNRFGTITLIYDTIILILVLTTGFLPRTYELFQNWLSSATWAQALYLFFIGIVISIPEIPFNWYAQFRLEERFGFNKSTLQLWIIDQLKGLAIGFVIGFPLIWFLLTLVGWLGDTWWLWGFAVVFIFEMVMMVLYPKLIIPLFNKLSPLPDGELRERLMALADRTGFKAKTIEVIDGSKRSGHSNAYFTGFGRFRRIVLYDTLVEQMTPEQIEAVLAHEIGHYKKGHIPKTIALSVITGLLGFWLLAFFVDSPWFYTGFGFAYDPAVVAPAFLLFGLVSGAVTFWFSPLANRLSRKFEYEADAFAKNAIGDEKHMIEALHKLSEKNLSNLTPHPIYSGFYYSHPTLLERVTALRK